MTKQIEELSGAQKAEVRKIVLSWVVFAAVVFALVGFAFFKFMPTQSAKGAVNIEGWPAVIKCQDSRKNVPFKLYHLIADFDGKIVYRHIGSKNDVTFNPKTRSVIKGETKSTASLIDCGKGRTLSKMIDAGQAYGMLKIGGAKK